MRPLAGSDVIEPETRERLGGGFDDAAPRYASARPSYPDAAVDWMVGAEPGSILDLGAGTGSLTRALARRAARLVAADPGHHLLLELMAATSVTGAVRTRAEVLPFADASFDVVTVATAFHWFDASRALPEIARVLRPGGRLALGWNTRVVHGGWTQELDRLLREAQPAALKGDWGTGSVRALEGTALFQTAEYAGFGHVQRLDRGGLVDLVSSRSYVIALDDTAREGVLSKVRDLFDTSAEPDGTVELPYTAHCWRVAVCSAAPSSHRPPRRPR